MDIALADGSTLFAHTGGVPFDPGRPVVVLVHGAGADHTLWRGQTRYLAHHGYAPLAVDLPGHGRSGGLPGSTIGHRADAVVALLDALGIERAALVGHSMGSLVVLDVAGRHPDRVTRLVLVSTNPEMGVHPVLIESAREGDDRCLRLTRAWQHGRPNGGDDEPGAWRAMVDWRITEQLGLDLYADDFVACRDWDRSSDRAVAVTCPVTVVSGVHDRMTGARGGVAMAELLGCEHIVVNAGHNIPGEAPWELTSRLVGLLGG